MKLSTGFEQACCILALLTTKDLKKPVTNKMLTEVMGVSPTYIKKITRKLVVAGLIMSTTGANGGFILGRPMNEITLYDVVKATDGDVVFFQPNGIIAKVFTNHENKVKKGLTIIEGALHEAQMNWQYSLQQVTLDTIAKEVFYV